MGKLRAKNWRVEINLKRLKKKSAKRSFASPKNIFIFDAKRRFAPFFESFFANFEKRKG